MRTRHVALNKWKKVAKSQLKLWKKVVFSPPNLWKKVATMLQRKIQNRLEEWYKSGRYKAPLLYGARQVGKTTAVREFANRHYKHFVEVNFVNPLFLLTSRISRTMRSGRHLWSNVYLMPYPPSSANKISDLSFPTLKVVLLGVNMKIPRNGSLMPAWHTIPSTRNHLNFLSNLLKTEDFTNFIW